MLFGFGFFALALRDFAPKKLSSPPAFFCFDAAVPGVLLDLEDGDTLELLAADDEDEDPMAVGLGDARDALAAPDDFLASSLTRFLITGAAVAATAGFPADFSSGAPNAANVVVESRGASVGAAAETAAKGAAGPDAGGRRILLLARFLKVKGRLCTSRLVWLSNAFRIHGTG